jgi:hypothetical protein
MREKEREGEESLTVLREIKAGRELRSMLLNQFEIANEIEVRPILPQPAEVRLRIPVRVPHSR